LLNAIEQVLDVIKRSSRDLVYNKFRPVVDLVNQKMKAALFAIAIVGMAAGVAAVPAHAEAPDIAQDASEAPEDIETQETQEELDSHPGEGDMQGPPELVQELLPEQAFQNIPGFLFQ